MDLRPILMSLAAKRKLFHSEADFQHALAWEIHERYPECQLRLEFTPRQPEPRLHVDLWVVGGGITAVELKYKTRRLVVEDAGESYDLMNHGAQDIGRYDFVKDISRVERIVAANGGVGYALLLTNDSAYWASPRGDVVCAAFQLYEGRQLEGSLCWAPHTGAGTMKGREAPIDLRGRYQVHWEDYSQVQPSSLPYSRFRYLLVRVG